MKKILLILSITLMMVWMIGFFVLKLSSPILHVFPVLSILAYLRSVMYVDNSEPQKNYETTNDSINDVSKKFGK